MLNVREVRHSEIPRGGVRNCLPKIINISQKHLSRDWRWIRGLYVYCSSTPAGMTYAYSSRFDTRSHSPQYAVNKVHSGCYGFMPRNKVEKVQNLILQLDPWISASTRCSWKPTQVGAVLRFINKQKKVTVTSSHVLLLSQSATVHVATCLVCGSRGVERRPPPPPPVPPVFTSMETRSFLYFFPFLVTRTPSAAAESPWSAMAETARSRLSRSGGSVHPPPSICSTWENFS